MQQVSCSDYNEHGLNVQFRVKQNPLWQLHIRSPACMCVNSRKNSARQAQTRPALHEEELPFFSWVYGTS